MRWGRRRDGAREAAAAQKRGGERGRNLGGAVSGAGGREGRDVDEVDRSGWFTGEGRGGKEERETGRSAATEFHLV